MSETQTLGQKPDTSPLVFRPPTLLFPPDRVPQVKALVQTPWIELGPAVQDKYLTKAYWLIKHNHAPQREPQELAQAIYQNNPAMFEF